MHSTNLPPAGKAISVDTTRPDGVYLTARIVEPTAVKLVNEGVYSAFSVGISKPRIIRDKVAKNGRVVDGIFSEVSVVDFPALPTAKFTVVKRASDEIETLEKSLTPVGTIFKKRNDVSDNDAERDKIPAEDVVDNASSVDSADPDNEKESEVVPEQPESEQDAEKAADAEVTKAGVDCDVCKGSGKDADGGDCEKCMGKGINSDVEKKKAESEDEEPDSDDDGVPDVDEQVTQSLADAADAVDDAQDAQQADNDAHTGANDDEKKKTKKSPEVDLTYAVRRAHDATCAAFSHDTLATVHPSVEKNGLKSVLDPSVIQRALAASIEKSSFEPEVIRDLTAAFEAASSLANSPDGEVDAAREMLHKSFTDAYPTASVTPGSVTPGQFQRPYVSAGRAPLSSTGASASLPYQGSNSVNAGDFDRSALTDDQEAPSPSSSEFPFPGNASAVDQLTAMSRDHALVSLTALHDHIQAAYPDICPLGGLGQGAPTVAGISGAGAETLDNSGSMTPLKTTAAVPTIEKSDDSIEDESATVAHVDGAEVLLDTEVLTSIVKTIVDERVATVIEEMQKKIDTVDAEVQKMASEPDPAQAPVRGTVTVERATTTKSVTEAEMMKQRAESDFEEQVHYLEKLSKSGNPELRTRAQAQLDTLLERAVMSGSVES